MKANSGKDKFPLNVEFVFVLWISCYNLRLKVGKEQATVVVSIPIFREIVQSGSVVELRFSPLRRDDTGESHKWVSSKI
jgi:hypothetical protein